MGAKSYAYQYETSPRKLRPEYDEPVRKKKTSTKAKAKKTENKSKKTKANTKTTQERQTIKEVRKARINFCFVMMITIACILLAMYRSVKINESFTEVQALSKTVSNLEKENSQITVNIQNNLNLSNIENIASSTLGMQKLSSKQTVYVNLDTKDYVEVTTQKAKVEQKPGFFKKIFSKIISIF